jgi:Holliday junction resolvase RusA-like endonuclease
MIAFTVYGIAQPKGNMRALQLRGMKFPIVTDSNKGIRSWSQLVAEGASQALHDLPPERRGLLLEAVRITVVFHLPRPKKYQKAGLPVAHLTRPDLDKLTRGVLDALTGVLWQDDAQVVELVAAKLYADVAAVPRVDVRIVRTAGTGPFLVPAAPASVVQPTITEAAEAIPPDVKTDRSGLEAHHHAAV